VVELPKPDQVLRREGDARLTLHPLDVVPFAVSAGGLDIATRFDGDPQPGREGLQHGLAREAFLIVQALIIRRLSQTDDHTAIVEETQAADGDAEFPAVPGDRDRPIQLETKLIAFQAGKVEA
jgi:hypothetical protein